MKVLQVVLTSTCNLSCAYCYQDRKPRRFMSGDILRSAVDLLLRSAGRQATLIFYGGEPLLAFPLMRQAVEHVEATRSPRTRVHYETSTNGTLLDGERTAFLERHRVQTQVSFDGLPAAQDLRQPGTFRRLDRRLRELRRSSREFFEECVEVSITLTGANLPTLADSVDYLIDLGLATIHISPSLPPDPCWNAASPVELRRQLALVCRSSRRHYRRTGRTPVAFLREERTRDRWSPPEMCAIGTGRSLTVDVDGQVRGCAMCVPSYQSFGEPGLREWIAPLRIGRRAVARSCRSRPGLSRGGPAHRGVRKPRGQGIGAPALPRLPVPGRLLRLPGRHRPHPREPGPAVHPGCPLRLQPRLAPPRRALPADAGPKGGASHPRTGPASRARAAETRSASVSGGW